MYGRIKTPTYYIGVDVSLPKSLAPMLTLDLQYLLAMLKDHILLLLENMLEARVFVGNQLLCTCNFPFIQGVLKVDYRLRYQKLSYKQCTSFNSSLSKDIPTASQLESDY